MNYKICHQIANHFWLKIYDTPTNVQKLVNYFKGYQPALEDGILIISDLSYHQAKLLVNQIPLDLIQNARDITYVYEAVCYYDHCRKVFSDNDYHVVRDYVHNQLREMNEDFHKKMKLYSDCYPKAWRYFDLKPSLTTDISYDNGQRFVKIWQIGDYYLEFSKNPTNSDNVTNHAEQLISYEM